MDLSGPENVPQMGKQEQTMMWQQAQYMGDSGIHSGATTQAPSVSFADTSPRKRGRRRLPPFAGLLTCVVCLSP